MLDTGLRDRVCLVTGAARGIGLETAKILAGEEVKLVLADIDEDDLVKAAEQHGLEDALLIGADLSLRPAVEQIFDVVHAEFGALDVLIHCAGVYRVAMLPDVTDDEWDVVMDANVKSSFLLAQAAVGSMREKGDGRIVLFGSFAARTGGLRAGVPYAASKAAVEGLMRNVAQYAGPLGIRVNCVHPGFTDTRMTQSLDERAAADAARAASLGRGSSPAEQAMAAVLLASDLTSYVHGVALDVNGGMYMA
jgi:3-oxoacyl-[acyl-carrier protein] reductase